MHSLWEKKPCFIGLLQSETMLQMQQAWYPPSSCYTFNNNKGNKSEVKHRETHYVNANVNRPNSDNGNATINYVTNAFLDHESKSCVTLHKSTHQGTTSAHYYDDEYIL